MKKSELKEIIREEIISILQEVTVVDKDTRPEEVRGENPLTVKTAIDTAKKSNTPVTIAEFDDEMEPSDSTLNVSEKDPVVKLKNKLVQVTREMKSTVEKWKTSQGEEKQMLQDKLKSLTQTKKKIEKFLSPSTDDDI
jgi:vacuolar-type H+-ATPase subunit I/STV1